MDLDVGSSLSSLSSLELLGTLLVGLLAGL